MIGVKFDFSDFERKANELSAAADQIPYVLARSLNQAAEDARTVLIVQTWPKAVHVRNTTFMRALCAQRCGAFTPPRATSPSRSTIRCNRAQLQKHARGGTKTARGAHLAIPSSEIPIGSHGVRKSDRPAALIARTPKRALRITNRGVYVGKGGRLHLKYALRRSVPIPADVPFESDFRAAMIDGVRTAFPIWIRKAMQTRRAR
jgi:hypothetical protein